MTGNVVTGFTGERAKVVRYGFCRVAIPRAHVIGSIGSSLLKRLLTLTDDRLKLVSLTAQDEADHWTAVAAALSAAAVGERDAVVFVHGYNVSFEEAAIRAAQLGADLGITGAMAFYSWPSAGTLKGYTTDEASIEASEDFIAGYLAGLASRVGAERVHIIAHSMGNRGVLRAIDRIVAKAGASSTVRFSQIVLAAADVDQDTFERLSVAYQAVADRTTLYVCERDLAVEASHWLHGYPRAGLTPPTLVVKGIDTVNVSDIDLTLLAHGYVGDAREVLQDMHSLLRGTPVNGRFGIRAAQTATGQAFWQLAR